MLSSCKYLSASLQPFPRSKFWYYESDCGNSMMAAATDSKDNAQSAFVPLAPFIQRPCPQLLPGRIVSRSPLLSQPQRRKRCSFVAATAAQGVSAAPSEPDPDSEASATSSSSSTPSDPFETAVSRLQRATESTFEAFFSPLIGSCSVLQRRWQCVGGNYILRPTKTPKAVLHFLGGAFFAAAPHILYHTFLERMCDRGYAIVATPFEIGFDHLAIAADIVDKWERVETDLAVEYGPLPVIGLGHSAGCVFHALGSSLFDDAAPKAANVFISFSNRKAADAIPMYKQVVVPTAATAMAISDALPEDVRTVLRDLPPSIVAAVEGNVLTPRRLRENVIPSVKESRRLVQQVWPLLEEIVGRGPRVDTTERTVTSSSGTKEFYPAPDEVEKSVSQLYAVENTLVVQFRDDALDDSDALAAALRARGEPAEVSVITMEGNHLTPLAQDLPDLAGAFGNAPVQSSMPGIASQGPAQTLMGVVGAAAQETVNALGLRELTALEVIIDEWVSKGLAEDKF